MFSDKPLKLRASWDGFWILDFCVAYRAAVKSLLQLPWGFAAVISLSLIFLVWNGQSNFSWATLSDAFLYGSSSLSFGLLPPWSIESLFGPMAVSCSRPRFLTRMWCSVAVVCTSPLKCVSRMSRYHGASVVDGESLQSLGSTAVVVGIGNHSREFVTSTNKLSNKSGLLTSRRNCPLLRFKI